VHSVAETPSGTILPAPVTPATPPFALCVKTIWLRHAEVADPERGWLTRACKRPATVFRLVKSHESYLSGQSPMLGVALSPNRILSLRTRASTRLDVVVQQQRLRPLVSPCARRSPPTPAARNTVKACPEHVQS